MSNPNQEYKHIYKILDTAPPSSLPQTLPLSDLDRKDGFIHLSTNAQVPATAGRFFKSHTKLWILKIKVSTFNTESSDNASLEKKQDDTNDDESRKTGGTLKWEASGDHGVFPHLYGGDLGRDVVEEVLEFERSSTESRTWEEVLGGLEP